VREISLHILDLIENSIRAHATVVAVDVEALPERNLLRIVIEDNGTGLREKPEDVLNPFYTTKRGKRTGLGLSLFKAAAEATGGALTLGPATTLGDAAAGHPGVRVVVEMGLRHIDRNPLGDLGATWSGVVCTNPEIDFRFRLRLGDRECCLSAAEWARELGEGNHSLAVARRVLNVVNEELRIAEVLT
jgi:signal transduction histidine kinase